MADKTKIEWADATLNVINGCSIISPGCTNCYAMRSGGRNLPGHPATGLTQPSKAGHVWTGVLRFNEAMLLQPLRWKRPRRIFWAAHGDMFHDSVPDEWIDRCFAVMALTPQHIHQVLTKRSARMRSYCQSLPNRDDIVVETARALGATLMSCRDVGTAIRGGLENMEHIWLGVSVEDQQRADERIPDLLATPAAVRWISAEPLLGSINLNHVKFYDRVTENGGREAGWESALNGLRYDMWAGDEQDPNVPGFPKLDWVAVGGESGPGARPMHLDWVRSLRDQCAAARVPFHFSQWGDFVPVDELDYGSGSELNYPCGIGRDDLAVPRNAALVTWNGAAFHRVGKKRAGRLLDGVTHDGMPGEHTHG